jgi:anti-sigma factor RsiW
MSSPLNHHEAAELLGAYALHALDRDERQEVVAHLDACARCRAEVRRYESVLSLFGAPG